GTFASQAAEHLRARYPEWGEIRYAPTGDALWTALAEGHLDVLVQTAETDQNGFSAVHARVAVPAGRVYVIAEPVVAYGCARLAKPGTRRADVRQVLGHGAAAEVAAGDGSLALVGTRITAEMYGLAELDDRVDVRVLRHVGAVVQLVDVPIVVNRAQVAG